MCRHAGNREPHALEIKTTQRKQRVKGRGGGTAGKKDGDRREGGERREKKRETEKISTKRGFFWNECGSEKESLKEEKRRWRRQRAAAAEAASLSLSLPLFLHAGCHVNYALLHQWEIKTPGVSVWGRWREGEREEGGERERREGEREEGG